MTILNKALSYARDAHYGQEYKPGLSYYLGHILKVVEIGKQLGFSDNELAILALHDILEDSNTTIEILQEDFGYPIAMSVSCLTNYSNANYNDYILSLAGTPVAKYKMVDLIANITSNPNPRQFLKYLKALLILVTGGIHETEPSV